MLDLAYKTRQGRIHWPARRRQIIRVYQHLRQVQHPQRRDCLLPAGQRPDREDQQGRDLQGCPGDNSIKLFSLSLTNGTDVCSWQAIPVQPYVCK